MSAMTARPSAARTRRAIAGSALALPLLAACAQGGSGSTESAQLQGVKEKVTLEVWHWDGFFKDTMENLGQGFSAVNPNASVAVLQTPFSQYYDKLQASIAGGTSPHVVGVHPLNSHSTANTGLYQDLNRYISADKSFDKADFFEVGLKAYSWKGQQYGIPHDSAFLHFYYNRELFRREGVKTPMELHNEGKWTWQTYLELANRFRRDTDGDGVVDQFGTNGENGLNYTRFTTFLWQNGADLFDAGYTKSTIASPAAQEAFTFLRETQRLAPQGEVARTSNFNTGKIAFWHDWHVRGETYLKNFQYQFGVAPMVKGKQQAQLFHGGPAWAMPAAGTSPDAAWQLVRHYTTKEAFTAQLQLWMMPARKSLDTNQFWASNSNLPPETRTAFQLAARTGRSTPRLARFNDVQAAINKTVGPFMRDEQSVASATAEAARELDRLLAEGGSDPTK